MASRCTEVHPQTRKRCSLDEGHREEHEPEPHTPEERETIANGIASDGMKAVELWTRRRYPPNAIAAGLLALYFRVEEMREQKPGDIMRSVIQCLAERELDDHELFVYIAEQLGVSCSVLKLPAQQRGQA